MLYTVLHIRNAMKILRMFGSCVFVWTFFPSFVWTRIYILSVRNKSENSATHLNLTFLTRNILSYFHHRNHLFGFDGFRFNRYTNIHTWNWNQQQAQFTHTHTKEEKKKPKSIFMVLLVSFYGVKHQKNRSRRRFVSVGKYIGLARSFKEKKKYKCWRWKKKHETKSYVKLIDEYGDEDETPTHGVTAKCKDEISSE